MENSKTQDNSTAPDNFETLAKKAEGLSIGAHNVQATKSEMPSLEDGEDQKVVDEIESLCMNCHENASPILRSLPSSS